MFSLIFSNSFVSHGTVCGLKKKTIIFFMIKIRLFYTHVIDLHINIFS